MNNIFVNIPEFKIISAYNLKNVIGDKNLNIPWMNDIKWKWDIEHYRETTNNAPIIMGYRTYTTFQKPFKNRYNIVISKEETESRYSLKNFKNILEKQKDDWIFVKNIESAMLIIILSNIKYNYNIKTAWIIGGEKTYFDAINKNIVSVCINSILNNNYDGIAFFPVNELNKYFVFDSKIDFGDTGNISTFKSKYSLDEINNNIYKLIKRLLYE